VRPFRIVVAGHGEFAAALLASAELIAGPIEDAGAVGLGPDDAPEAYGERLREVVGSGPCLVLADLAGGTPANVALVVGRDRRDVVVVAGATLGMLLEAATGLTSLDDAPIDGLVAAARSGVVRQDDRIRSPRSV
jgi:mannose/fructose-specific phosphotransferase system component IIA